MRKELLISPFRSIFYNPRLLNVDFIDYSIWQYEKDGCVYTASTAPHTLKFMSRRKLISSGKISLILEDMEGDPDDGKCDFLFVILDEDLEDFNNFFY